MRISRRVVFSNPLSLIPEVAEATEYRSALRVIGHARNAPRFDLSETRLSLG
jgi:hypothetical protein